MFVWKTMFISYDPEYNKYYRYNTRMCPGYDNITFLYKITNSVIIIADLLILNIIPCPMFSVEYLAILNAMVFNARNKCQN